MSHMAGYFLSIPTMSTCQWGWWEVAGMWNARYEMSPITCCCNKSFNLAWDVKGSAAFWPFHHVTLHAKTESVCDIKRERVCVAVWRVNFQNILKEICLLPYFITGHIVLVIQLHFIFILILTIVTFEDFVMQWTFYYYFQFPEVGTSFSWKLNLT